MDVIIWYAIACGVAGIMPCSFPFLMALEIGMIYHLSVFHKIPFRLGELAVIWAILLTASIVLKIIVGGILIWFPGPGWVIKGAIAFGFVMGVGWLVDSYYATERRKLEGSASNY